MKIVIKVGNNILTSGDKIAKDRMLTLVRFISDLREKHDVILVTSGAVAAGYTKLKLDKSILKNRQALAAIGQPTLMKIYDELFNIFGIMTSQVLVTAHNLNRINDIKRINNNIDTLLENNILPIINENDATCTAELEVGDNDQLSAYLTKQSGADLLVLLSDVEGYYNCDPKLNDNAELFSKVITISTDDLLTRVQPGNEYSSGGIITKLKSAKYLMESGIDTFLTTGHDLTDVKSFLLADCQIGGTLFTSKHPL